MVIFRKDNKKYNIKFDGNKQEIYQIAQKFMIWEHTVKNKTDLKSFFKTMFFDENLELIGGYQLKNDLMAFLFYSSDREIDDMKNIEVLSNF